MMLSMEKVDLLVPDLRLPPAGGPAAVADVVHLDVVRARPG